MKKNILAVVLGLGLMSLERVLAAGPFSVTTFADTHAVSPTVSANDGSGQISLRSAIEAANAQAGATIITLMPGTYMLTLGELSVAPAGGKTITIQSLGTAADTIVSQMDHTNRVFNIDQGSAGGTVVTLSGLTIQGGRDAADQLGGAGILAGSFTALPKDVLNLTGCRILNNHCLEQASDYTAQSGGGVQMGGGDLTITSCVFSNNTSASSQGGAIEFFAQLVNSKLTVDSSSFFNNGLTNTSGSGPIGGGAIDIRTMPVSVHEIRNSTFAGDHVVSTTGSANTVGGAIYLNTGTLVISNSVFTGNSVIGTGGLGGAIFADSGILNLNGCRLTDNVAAGGGGALYNRGSNGANSAAINCWWGCNDGPGASGCDVATSDTVGTLITSPFIVLSNAPSLNPILLFQSTTFTASFRYNSAGTLLTPTQISTLVGMPVNWGNPVLGSLSGGQTVIQADGTASATFTAGHVAGIGSVTASVDHAFATGAVTVDCPSITATVSGGAAFCASGAGVIQVDVTGGYPPYTVTLNNGGGTQTGNSPLRFTNSPAVTTVYQVAVGTDTNGCGIVASGSATNTVFTAPDGTIAAASAGVCADSTGNLASAPAGAASYAWTIDNGTIAGPANAATISYGAGVAGNVTLGLTVTSTNGCVTVASTNVLINPLPLTPTILAATSVCAGSTGNSATAGGTTPVVKPLDAPTTTYAWTIGNGMITSATNLPTITYTAGSTGAVSLAVVVLNASGCSASAVAEVAITAHPTAVVSGSATISTGSSTPLLAALTGTAPWTVTWSDGFVQTTNASPALHYVSPTNTLPEPVNYTYTVTALTDASCVAGETDISGSATVAVYSMPAAPTNLTGVAAVCFQTPNPLLTVAVATNATVDWYDAATGGNVLTNDSLVYLPTNSAPGSYTNFAQARDLSTGTVNTNRTPVIFTINALPTAVVSGDAAICNGDSAVISVALTGVSPWTIQWFDGVIQTTNASPAIRVVSPANMLGTAPTNMVYFLSAAADANCSADSVSVRSSQAVITVNPVPLTPWIRTAGGVCAGSAGNQAGAPAGAMTYAWTITNGVITSSVNSSNITYTAADSGLVTLGVTAFNTYGCSASTVTNVIINPLPITPVIAADAGVCAGSSGNTAAATSVVPTVVGKDALPPLTYLWAITNGVITSATNVPTITYTAGTNGAVGLTVVALNQYGCSAGTEIAVPINALPTAVVSGDAAICNGDSAVVSVALTGVSPWTIQWSDGVIQTTNASPAIRVVSPANSVGVPTNVVFTVTGLADAHCSTEATNDLTGSATITVNPLPAPFLIHTSFRVCAGSVGNIASGPAGAAAYAWTITNGEITSAVNSSNITYTAGNYGIVTLGVTVFNTYGCSISTIRSVHINELPPTPVILADARVCAGSSGNSASVNASPTFPYWWSWSITNGVITSDTSASTITYTAGTNGAVGLTVVFTNAAGCTTGTEIAVPINALPASPVIALSPASVCAQSAGNTASGPAGASAYAWTITNGIITSATNLPTVTYTAGETGSVALSLTVWNESGCSEGSVTNVTINALPALPQVSLSTVSLCGNSIGNTASGPDGAAAYAWTISNGFITSETNLPVITYTAGATGAVTLGLTVFNESGCSATVMTNVVIDPDTVAPDITCPGNMLVIVPAGTSGSNVTFTVPVVDNCDPNPLVTIVPPSGSTFLPGTTTVNVTAADHSGNTNTCQFTVRVHPEPTVGLITPTNGSIFVVPQNIALLADASNPDASITQVDFYEQTNLLATATSGFWFNWTNVAPGSYQLLAVATDDVGITGTSAVVNVSMLAHVPLPVGSIFPVETNSLRVRQTGLLYQQVHVSNVTPLTMAALRLSISNLPPAVRVWNATGTNNGLPYLLYNQPLQPGESVDFLIEYYVADGRTLPNPTFICDLIPTETPLEPVGTVQAVNQRSWGGAAPLMEFRTQTNRVYYIQYSPDLTTWKTALPAINGTGSSVQWIDNGPPKTESLPSSVPSRFYRVLLIP